MDVESRINQFKTMTEADPENDLGHFSLGKAYLEAGRHEEAEPCFSRVLELNPAYSKAYQFLGRARLELGRRDEAAEVLKRGCEVAGERGDVMPHDEMAKMLSDLGEVAPSIPESAAAATPSGGEAADGFRCTRCGRPHGKLDERPFKGELGERIHASICADCWREWIAMGTKVINEMGLQLADAEHQATYDQYMKEFLQFDD